MKRKYKNLSIRESYIKDRYMLFVSAVIENPSFSSQTKEELTSHQDKFGSICEFSKSFYNNVVTKLSIVNDIVNFVKAKEMRDLAGKDVKKKSTLRSIPKLDDANLAGTNKSSECTLILTEGDSAKTMAVSGIGAIEKGRNIFGVFPLKGKLLNVREANNKQIANNDEIVNLRKIIGLQIGKEYTKDNINELRYGRIMIMTDADVDGSHIKGLFFNFLHHFFNTLIKVEGFVTALVTPVVKVSKGSEILSFDNLTKFEEWKNKTNISNWKIKYYKGLGTNTTQEAKEYFKYLDKYTVTYTWDNKASDDAIQLAFSKDLVEGRKKWLRNYDKDNIIERTQKIIPYYDFINKDLIHFSNSDNLRSIPVMCDGLKPSHRKVLYAGFKKNLLLDIKVSQFVGYISEHSAYHHGEMSLTNTIIGMAQNFTGSNNINLYIPSGQFGTRLAGGKDHSSSRYIFTRLSKITRLIYHPHDDAILNYLTDDGMSIEPEYYIPIIPMILVNGSEGIGTGFSTFVPKFSPKDLIFQLQQKLKGDHKWGTIKPSYTNYNGDIHQVDKTQYITKGKYTIIDNKITISELPIGLWSNDYKTFLEDLTFGTSKLFSNLENYCTESKVNFVMKITDKKAVAHLDKEKSPILNYTNLLEKKLRLVRQLNTSNMYLYNTENYLNKYEKISDILEEFYNFRLQKYKERKDYLIKQLKNELNILSTKVKFITDMILKKIDLSNKNKETIIKLFESKQFYKIPDEPIVYDYLLRMPFYSLTKEKVEDLNKLHAKKKQEFDELNKKSPSQLWLDDLDNLSSLL